MTEERSPERELTLVQETGIPFLEGPWNRPYMRDVQDVRSILEQCFSHQVRAVLLYSPNLTERFFDLSSGEAGEILQKMFQYGMRLAIVLSPSAPPPSKKFGEFMAEEAGRGRLALFDSVHAARVDRGSLTELCDVRIEQLHDSSRIAGWLPRPDAQVHSAGSIMSDDSSM